MAGYFVELLFRVLHLIPSAGHAFTGTAPISWNYTTWLNIVAALLSLVLVVRFVRTNGIGMLRMMDASPSTENHCGHG